jgi:SAM-dependent methyltransferase
MNPKAHWDKVYETNAPDALSWYRPHLDASLALIERVIAPPHASIIDVGGGESTLVDDLLARGYREIALLDISETAVRACQKRLGADAARVQWLVCDVTATVLPSGAYDLWHDRAVFHFLTEPRQRLAYVRNVARAVKRGGHVIVGTFGPEGPTHCSGLGVMRFDADSLHQQFGSEFRLVDSFKELHKTPFGATQQFVYCYCRVE